VSAHTPGPWEVTPRGNVATQSAVIAKLPTGQPSREANARLIAAAPELLEALKRLLSAGMGRRLNVVECGEEIDRAKAAIAKAEGGGK